RGGDRVLEIVQARPQIPVGNFFLQIRGELVLLFGLALREVDLANRKLLDGDFSRILVGEKAGVVPDDAEQWARSRRLPRDCHAAGKRDALEVLNLRLVNDEGALIKGK